MTTGAQSVADGQEPRPLTWSRVGWFASIAFFGLLPVLLLVVLFGEARGGTIAIDFRQFYGAAEAILRGESPYSAGGESTTNWGGPYPYPPLPALLAIPLTVLSGDGAGLVVMGLLAVAALAVLYVLGVRDWRCYGVAIMWPPVISAIQTGNLTLWLALACAVAWRFRDRPVAASASIGVTLAAKLFLWPLVAWFLATRRTAAAVLTSVFAVGLLILSWAAIGFVGLVDYPDLLQRLDAAVGEDSYTMYVVGLDLGMSSALARGLWLVVGLALVAGVVHLGRRGDERSAFMLAIAASLALTPIVWLHYFALLLVVVALAQPRLGVVWFIPFAMVITPGSGHPTPFETSATLLVAAVTIVLALRASLSLRRDAVGELVPHP